MVQQGIKLTDEVIKKLYSRMVTVSKCRNHSKVHFLSCRDAIFSQEDLISDSILKLLDAIKNRDLSFSNENALIRYALTIYKNRLTYHIRSKVGVQKSNGITVGWDTPACSISEVNGDASHVVTVGDVISKELHMQFTEHCFDMLDVLKKNAFVRVTKDFKVSLITASSLSILNATDKIFSLNKYLFDRSNMTRKELSDKYIQRGIYLGKKVYEALNEEIDKLTSKLFEGELCLN